MSIANQAALEVGQGAIIPVDANDPTLSADKVLAQLSNATEATPSQSLPTWQAAADVYAEDLHYWRSSLAHITS